MCPEAEKKIRELKEERKKRVYVVKGVSRRDLLKAVGLLPVFSLTGILGSLRISQAVDLGVFNWGCLKCSVGFCLCVKGFPPRVHPSIYNSYWYPVGFIEINRTCEFLTSLLPVLGDVVGGAISSLCDMLPKGWVQGTDMSQNTGAGRVGQQYMRVHARWYGMTPEVEALVSSYLAVTRGCLCPVVDMVKNVTLGPVYGQLEELTEKLEKLRSRAGKVWKVIGGDRLMRMVDRVTEVLDSFDFPLPVWFTEILSPIWLIDVLSVDSVLTGNLRKAVVLTLASHPVSKVALCSGILNKLSVLPSEVRRLIDPSFVCVGFWGYGYPRIGVVRNDDPLIAHLLASARFHHLFSKTIRVIPFEYDPNNIRYQLVRPFSSECMKPGCGGFSVPNLCEFDGNPASLFNMLKNKAVGLAGRTMNVRDRKTFLVVWKKESKCCC